MLTPFCLLLQLRSLDQQTSSPSSLHFFVARSSAPSQRCRPLPAMSHRPHRAHSREEADEGHARSRSSSGGRGMHGHSSASSSSAAAAAVAASSSAAARASSSNPLETLLKDLKCNICLSLARNPISLPCNHFFCDSCLTNMMDSEQERTKSVRKAKKNDSIRLDMHCPNCREVYTRRNIVEDQVLRQMSKLCLQLQKQPDVKELLSTGQWTDKVERRGNRKKRSALASSFDSFVCFPNR